MCQFVVLLHSSRTTGGVKYIEINNIPQITLANKRIESILVTVLEGDLLCLHFDLFLLLFVGLTKKRGGYMKCVCFGHHADTAELSAQRLTYSEQSHSAQSNSPIHLKKHLEVQRCEIETMK